MRKNLCYEGAEIIFLIALCRKNDQLNFSGKLMAYGTFIAFKFYDFAVFSLINFTTQTFSNHLKYILSKIYIFYFILGIIYLCFLPPAHFNVTSINRNHKIPHQQWEHTKNNKKKITKKNILIKTFSAFFHFEIFHASEHLFRSNKITRFLWAAAKKIVRQSIEMCFPYKVCQCLHNSTIFDTKLHHT
jgi:hypothetical protein